MRIDRPDHVTHLVLDLDPPEGDDTFAKAVQAAFLVRQALADAGLTGAVKTSGAKGVHVIVPIDDSVSIEDAAAATRAIAARAERIDPEVATTAYIKEDRHGKVFVDSTRAGGATVVATYSPRIRPGTTVSFPVGWDDLDRVTPRDFTVKTAVDQLAGVDRWAGQLPGPQSIPEDVLEEGRAMPIARVVAMHEGKRRKRAQREAEQDG